MAIGHLTVRNDEVELVGFSNGIPFVTAISLEGSKPHSRQMQAHDVSEILCVIDDQN